jgi:hypothetical protein
MTPEAWQLSNLPALLAAGFQLNEDRMTDLFDDTPAPERKPRPKKADPEAEAKAALVARINELCARVPKSIVNGSAESVVAWKAARIAALKVAGNKRAALHDLTSALSSMERYKN